MMRWAWFVVAALGAAPLGCELISGLDGLTTDDASLDGEADDAPVDAVGDSPLSDGSDTGPSCGTWCQCNTSSTAVVLCDDFDRAGETLGDIWDGGASSGPGATIVLALDASFTPPGSLIADVPNGNMTVQAVLTEGVAPLMTRAVSLSFEMRIGGSSNNCTTLPGTLGALVRVGTSGGNGVFAAVGYAATPLLYIQAGSASTTVPIPTGITRGEWVHVDFSTGYFQTDAGQVIAGVVYLADGGTKISVDAQAPAASGQTLIGTTVPLGPTVVAVGAMQLSSTIPCAVQFDNVVIVQ
jgi:hypothetical protein